MDIITTQDLQKLLRSEDGWHVSLFMPAHRAGRETEQDRIRYRNLLSQVDKRLLEKGIRTPDVKKMMEGAEKVALDPAFWRGQSDGLAVFFNGHSLYTYRLPLPFEELVVISDRFHLKPLLPFFSSDGQFYILALSQNQVRLLKGSRYTVDEIELENLPKSLREALPYEQFERQLQFHTGTPSGIGERGGVFHGHDPREDDKQRILRWFHKINDELTRMLSEEHAPVVLAGVDFLFSLYEEANSYPNLLKEGVAGNPDELKPAELHNRAWQVVQPTFSEAQHKAAAQYQKLAGSGSATADIKEALLAAHHGRVETLFVKLGVHVWGVFDAEADQVTVHEQAEQGDLDLLDLAAAETLLKGGEVYAVESDEMPAQRVVAAIFRY